MCCLSTDIFIAGKDVAWPTMTRVTGEISKLDYPIILDIKVNELTTTSFSEISTKEGYTE